MSAECRTQQIYPQTNQVLLDPSVHINSLYNPNFKRKKLSQQFNTCDCLSFHPFPITNRVSGPNINNQEAELCNKKTSNKQGALVENAYFVGDMLLKGTSNNVVSVSYCNVAQLPTLWERLCNMNACSNTPL
jgi:hypothetical protein